MDWTTFLRDNSQVLFTLLGTLLGAVIASIVSVVTNIFQVREKEKDRKEQRREAKIQLELELMRNDTRIIRDSIDNCLRLIDELQTIKDKNLPTSKTDEEIAYEYVKSHLTNENKLNRLYESVTVAEKIALSLGEDFFIEYEIYRDRCKQFFNRAISSPSEFINDDISVVNILRSAGKLHLMLQDKLISLRN